MNNFFILIPTFNDWRSLNRLLFFLNKSIKGIKGIFRVVIVNDNSSEKIKLQTKNLYKIKSLKILNLKKNIGSQKAIYIGLKYIKKYNYKSVISVLDSDGEDNPFKLKKLINLALKKKDCVFVANRSERRENIYLRYINKLRLLITFLLTGKYINFGNFSSFSSDNLNKIFLNSNLWLAFSSGILKNCEKIIPINIKKKKRYYGNSKVKIKFLVNHTIKIICVFKKEILIRSLLAMLFVIFFFKDSNFSIKLIMIFIFLNIFIYIYYRINALNFNVLKLIKNIDNIKK